MKRCIRAKICEKDNLYMMDDLCGEWAEDTESSKYLKKMTADRIDCIRELYKEERKPLKLWYPLGI